MSIFGAMFSGVTGLDAQSQALGMIADNISNVNTVGYKATTARFSTLVTESASRTRFTPGGVSSLPSQGIDRQGLLQSSASRTDIAIAGRGLFVVNEAATPATGNEYLFTRAGSFNPDENGNLVNTGGYFLQGWPLTNGTTLPSNTSVLTSVKTVNVSNLAGTASATTNVNLALNLPSIAAAATGGGKINQNISGILMAGITDIDYKTFGALGQVGQITYDQALKRITVDIGGQTGTFDVSAQLPQTYTSTGTLAGMELTLDANFNYNSDINIPALANSFTETDLRGIDLADYSSANDLTGIQTISFDGTLAATDEIVTVAFDSVSGTLTVTDASGDSGTAIIGTTGGSGTKDFTLTGGTLSGTIVTINTNTFDFTTSFNNAANTNTLTTITPAPTNNRTFTTATTTLSQDDIRLLSAENVSTIDFTYTQVAGAGPNDTVVINSGLTGWTPTVTVGDLFAGTAATVTFTKGAVSFDVALTASGAVTDGETIRASYTLNELKNKVVVDAGDLTITPASVPTVLNFDANDLAALDASTMTFNVDARGRVVMESGPTGFSVNQNQTQPFTSTGLRNVVVTDGTNTFTVQLNVQTAVTAGSTDIVVDLADLTNNFGLGTPTSGGQFSSTVQVFDSLGNAHDVEIQYLKEATNQWTITVLDPVLAATGVKSGTTVNATRSITFNGNGTPQTIAFPNIRLTGLTTGALDADFSVNLGTVSQADGATQFAGEFAISSIDQNGVRFGGFVGVSIDEKGKVTAVFDNGEQLAIYQLPIAVFANPNGLEPVNGNAFRQSDISGDILLQQANSGGSGTVASSALESSTVDLAEEFTRMITTQRAYSASAKIITTADEMLEELIRIRR
jgi:flagellar hook protein FlgE